MRPSATDPQTVTQAPQRSPLPSKKPSPARTADRAKKITKPAAKGAAPGGRRPQKAGAADGPPDRRAARRFEIDKPASAAFDFGRSMARCGIVDISETGARLKFTNARTIPATFTLYVEEDGFFVECEVVWRREGRVGVRFAGAKVPTIGQRVVHVDHPRTPSGRKMHLAPDTMVISERPPRRAAERPEAEDAGMPARRLVFGKRDGPN
jgi:hypothetical protein